MMITTHRYANIGFVERALRTTTGIFLLLLAFMSPIEATWLACMAIAASYSLITALTAWDPGYGFVEFARARSDHYFFLHH